MEVDFIPLVKDFLSKNKIVIADTVDLDELMKKLAHHFEALIFNITSIAGMIAVIHGDKKIMPRHLVAAQTYIAYQCVGEKAVHKIEGGKIEFPTEKDMDNIPLPKIEGLEMDATAKKCVSMDMREYIQNVITFHNITISKGAMSGMIHMLKSHLGCLLKEIKKKEPLTMKRLEYIMTLKRNSAFN